MIEPRSLQVVLKPNVFFRYPVECEDPRCIVCARGESEPELPLECSLCGHSWHPSCWPNLYDQRWLGARTDEEAGKVQILCFRCRS
jgi:hypothetical protein